MKIERETGKDYGRWSIEMHPWVEVLVVAFFCTVVGGSSGVAIFSGLARLLGY